MAELSQIQQTSIYNQVYPLQKPEYAQEVTEVSKKSFVAVLLVSSHGTNEESRLMIDIWRDLARQFGDIKFCQMQADLCIEGYPDRLTPTVLLYKDGDIKEQIVTLKDMNGLRTTSKGVYIKIFEPTIEVKLIGRLRFHRHARASRRHQSRRHQNRARWLSVQPQQRLSKKGEERRIPPNSIMYVTSNLFAPRSFVQALAWSTFNPVGKGWISRLSCTFGIRSSKPRQIPW